MNLGLKEKVAIVTGSGRGIGKTIARTLAEEGTNVVIADLDEETGKNTAQEIAAIGKVATLFVKVDISKWEDVVAMAKATVDKLGKIDILVNNAAVVMAPGKIFAEASMDQRRLEVEVIFNGTLNCIQVVLDRMIKQESGSIVSIITDGARSGDPRISHYSACKAGVASLARSVAREVGQYHIRVNNVSPGLTLTETAVLHRREEEEKLGKERFQEIQRKRLKSYPLGRFGDPQDIANAVAFLASDRASWITGQTLSVSGGYAIGPW